MGNKAGKWYNTFPHPLFGYAHMKNTHTHLLLLVPLVLFVVVGLASRQPLMAAPEDVLELANDSGVMAQGYDQLVGKRTLAVRLEFGAVERPIRVDAVRVYLAPQEGMGDSFPIFVRVERPSGTRPGGEMITSKAIRLTVTEPGWYEIPIQFLYPYDDPAVIITIKSDDFPWATPPLVGLDDGTNIPAGYNYYGENFTNWVEHYGFWTQPETVGNLMIRARIATGEDAENPPPPPATATGPPPPPTETPTPTATPTPIVTTPPPTSTPPPTPTPPTGFFIELGAGKDAYLKESDPDVNFGKASELLAGYQLLAGELQTVTGGFPLPALPLNTTVLRAELALHLQEASENLPEDLQAYALTRNWEETEITYANGQDLWGKGYGFARQDDNQPEWVTFDVTALVQAWVREEAPMFGIGVRAGTRQNPAQLAMFDAHEVPFLGPRLRIHYITQASIPLYLPMVTVP